MSESKINTARIRSAASEIDVNSAALKWLERYGSGLTGRDRRGFSFSIHLNYAGSVHGAKEASEVLESFANLEIEKLVLIAIQNCKNTIEIALNSISEEAANGVDAMLRARDEAPKDAANG